MATPVQNIYRRFLSRIGTDILTEIDDKAVAEEIMLIFLEDALCEIEDYYDKDFTITDSKISCDLTSKEIGTIANAMLLYWLQPQIHTQEMIKMQITDGDYTKKNTASLLDKLLKLKDSSEKTLRKSLIKQGWKGKVLNE